MRRFSVLHPRIPGPMHPEETGPSTPDGTHETGAPRSWLRSVLEPHLAAISANTLPSIVVIEDDGDIARGLAFTLSGGYRVETTDRGGSALELLSHGQPDLLLVDFQLPDTNGIALIAELRQRGTTCPAIMISAYENQREASLAAGFDTFILKPWENGELVWHIENALAHPS